MLHKFGGLCLILLVLAPAVFAQDAIDVSQLPGSVQQQVEASNRFLSAEVGKQIRSANEQTLQELKDYQTENFVELDMRMSTIAEDMKKKLILGGIGAMLLASGIVAIVYMWITKRYSYEVYLQNYITEMHKKYEPLKDGEQKIIPLQAKNAQQERIMAEMQQRDWQYGRPTQGLTATGVIDQSQAADYSQLNEHQYNPAYAGAWVPEQGQGVFGQQQFTPQGQVYQEVPPQYPQQQYPQQQQQQYPPQQQQQWY